MADIEKIEQALREGLDACTSGPWSVDNHIIAPGDIGESWAVFETCEDDPPIIMCLEWQQEANARHIARCSPENIRALLDELSRLREMERRASDILKANDDFRLGMPADWEGDPLQDACDAMRRALSERKEGQANG